MNRREAIVYGRRAALAVAEHRPNQIIRVFYSNQYLAMLAPIFKAAAQQRKPYRQVSDEELYRICHSDHHEGIVVVTEPLETQSIEDAIQANPQGVWIALDDVENDHNLGAIARSISWFGATGLIWQGNRAYLSGASMRVAQGAFEQIALVVTQDLASALIELKKAGVKVVGADQNDQHNALNLSAKSPICWVLGSEQFGLSPQVKSVCDHLASVPGTGQMESLNVSVTAGILLAQSYQANHSTKS
jgi:TrmH RNA methyltransferase